MTSSCSRKTGSSESSAPAPVSSILPRPAATASAVSASSTRKKPAELSAVETARLLEYKIYQLNFSSFSKKLSENFLKNGGYEEIRCSINCDTDQMFSVTVTACNEKKGDRDSGGIPGQRHAEHLHAVSPGNVCGRAGPDPQHHPGGGPRRSFSIPSSRKCAVRSCTAFP